MLDIVGIIAPVFSYIIQIVIFVNWKQEHLFLIQVARVAQLTSKTAFCDLATALSPQSSILFNAELEARNVIITFLVCFSESSVERCFTVIRIEVYV